MGEGNADYATYLKSEHWKIFKRRYKASGRPQTCKLCGCNGCHLHHITYVRLNRELLDDVVPLCGEHHEAIHEIHAKFGIPLENFEQAASYVMRDRPRGGNKMSPEKRAAIVAEQKSVTDGYRAHLAANGIDHKTGKKLGAIRDEKHQKRIKRQAQKRKEKEAQKKLKAQEKARKWRYVPKCLEADSQKWE